MLHVRVALDREEVAHSNGAVARHASHVVATQVHEHHVLGALFLVGEQDLRQRVVLGWRLSAGPRPSDRPHRYLAVLHPHEHLG